jgi:hypothetical protein
MLEKIYDFCAVREDKRFDENSKRFAFLIDLLESLGIKYTVDAFEEKGRKFKNIILDGTTNFIFTAHYDIINLHSDNANDNSASVINLIYLKTLQPEARVVILDGEEPPIMGGGSRQLSTRINEGMFGHSIIGVVNLELTGYGDGIFTDKRYANESLMVNEVKTAFEHQPFNDSDIFIEHKIPSVCYCLLPVINGQADYSPVYDIHTTKDSVDKVKLSDMAWIVSKLVDVYFK